MKFYRYVWVEYAEHDYDGELCSPKLPNPKITINTFELKKETEKGYWIGIEGIDKAMRWISKSSKKRYAYPTKEEALLNFIKRTEKRVKILSHDLACCEIAIKLAQSIQPKQ